jgi:purine-binding chemotaxis protein CheW
VESELIMKKNTTDIYTSFHLDNTEIAITIEAVQEVVNLPERIIPMPLAPEFLLGVFNLRGIIIPIINLKKLLKHPDCAVLPTNKVAIVDISGARVGLIFDSTSEILRVSKQDVSDFNYVSDHSHKIISGAIKLNNGERILQILEAPALITIENVPQILEQQKIKQVNLAHSRLDQRHKCISFFVKNIKMAFEISKIYEIIKVPELKPSSIQSPIFLGIINLRGITIPVVCFTGLLKMPKLNDKEAVVDDQRIIILKMGDELIGMMVDFVECINSYCDEDLMSVPVLSKGRIGMFKGCLNLPNQSEIFLIEHEQILSNQEILEVTEGHSKIYQATRDNTVLKKMNRESYISFRLDHLFGVSIKDIKEIINYSEDILSAPGMPSFVKGMLNLRSQLVTIIDTRSLYKMPASEEVSSEAKVLIFDKDGERFGLVVDSLESILAIDQDKKFKVPSLVTQKIQTQFQDDIKEIVSIALNDKESALIILNMESVTDRIKNFKAA